MTIATRRIIYYFFCLLFLVLTALITLYASGYEIDWQRFFTPLAVQKTGMAIIYSEPAGAAIYLGEGGEKQPAGLLKKIFSPGSGQPRTPSRMRNLLPGSYDLRVELAGYWPWKRRIKIFPEKITHVIDINLFKISSPEFAAGAALENISLSPNGKKIFLPSSRLLFDLKTGKTEELAASSGGGTEASWSADSNKLLFGHLLVNFKNGGESLDLNKLIGPDISNLKWGGETDKIFYQYKNSVNRFDLADKNNETIAQEEKILDYLPHNKELFYAVNNGLSAKLKIYSFSEKKITGEITLPLSDGYKLINPGSKLINLYDEKSQTLYLVDPSASAPNPLIETITSVKKTEWVNDNELVWANDFEIWTLDLDKNEKRLITRWSEPIKGIVKTKTENYLIYSTEKTINVITWTVDGEIQVTELASLEEIYPPIYDLAEKNLYFTAASGGKTGLYKFNIQ
jgi:hypothetical protein